METFVQKTTDETDEEMSESTNMNDSESGALPQWQEARSRLEAYLRALSPASPEQQERIVSMTLERALAKDPESPEASPVELVMNEFQNSSDEWFRQTVSPTGPAAPGLVSYLAIDGDRKWPEAFLTEPVPADLRQELRSCEVQAAPDLRVSRMVPEPFDNLLQDLGLPTALTLLTKDLPPSLVAKVGAFVMSGLALVWGGNRMR